MMQTSLCSSKLSKIQRQAPSPRVLPKRLTVSCKASKKTNPDPMYGQRPKRTLPSNGESIFLLTVSLIAFVVSVTHSFASIRETFGK